MVLGKQPTLLNLAVSVQGVIPLFAGGSNNPGNVRENEPRGGFNQDSFGGNGNKSKGLPSEGMWGFQDSGVSAGRSDILDRGAGIDKQVDFKYIRKFGRKVQVIMFTRIIGRETRRCLF
jgi:hypothetical protein